MPDFDDERVGAYVGGYGNPHAALTIVGEAPGPDEAKEGIPFIGTTGKMLAETLAEAGVRIDDCYRTNVFKYHPPGSDIRRAAETGHTITEGLPQLQAEIDSVNSNAILAVGDLALSTLTGKEGIFTWRGSILPTKDGKKKVIGTVHPASLFKRKGNDQNAIPWRFWYIIKQDIYRAVEDSAFPELRLPIRQHRICRSSLDLERFLEKYKDKTLASVDIEAHHNIPITIAIAFNAEEAMSIALFNVGSWAVPGKGLSLNDRVRIWKILHKFFADTRIKFIGQNFKYDHEKLKWTLGFNIGHNRLHADVGMMSHVVQPEFRISLEFLTSIYTREQYYKAEGKEFEIGRHPLEQLMTYNCKDALVTYEIYEKLLKDLEELGLVDFYFNYKNELHDFYMDMERVGFRVDEKVRIQLWIKYVDMFNALMEEIKKETGYYINPNSVPDVKWLLFKILGLPERKDTQDETLSLLYANHAKTDTKRVAIRNILRGRQCRKTMSTYLGAMPDFDGRMRCSWRIPGTETDRSATHMLEAPVRPEFNTKSGKTKKKKKIGIMLHNLTKHGDIGTDVRTMYIPDEGEVFGSADESQAEARIVALLAGDKDLLKLFDTVDIHSLTASWLFGVALEKIEKKGPLRQIAKSVRHAGNYGMGKRKLVELLAVASTKYSKDLNMSEWRAGELLNKFHEYTPRIRSVFHAGVIDCLKSNNRTLVNPFGRPRTFHERWGEDLFREAFADIPQSTVPEQLKMAALRVKKRIPEVKFVNEAHDAIDWACRPEDFDRIARVVKEEMERPIDFSKCSIPRGVLIIPAEVKIATKNYNDFADYKFAA